jgi:hypothetical protein
MQGASDSRVATELDTLPTNVGRQRVVGPLRCHRVQQAQRLGLLLWLLG